MEKYCLWKFDALQPGQKRLNVSNKPGASVFRVDMDVVFSPETMVGFFHSLRRYTLKDFFFFFNILLTVHLNIFIY